MTRCSFFFFSSRRRHTRFDCDWSSDVCSSDLGVDVAQGGGITAPHGQRLGEEERRRAVRRLRRRAHPDQRVEHALGASAVEEADRKSTRLNSSHSQISYAVFCLKKKKYKY